MLNSLHKVLSSIKNGQKNNLLVVTCKESKIAIQVLNVLQENGFILGYRYKKGKDNEINNKELEILLKYNKEKPVIKSCELISKPSKKVYKTIQELQSMQEMQRRHKEQITIGNKKSSKTNITNGMIKERNNRKMSLSQGQDEGPFVTNLRNERREKRIKNPTDESGLIRNVTINSGEKNWKSLINGMYILTTTKGIISDKTAFKYNISGQIICKIN